MAGGPGKEVRSGGQQHTKSPEGKALLLEHAPEGVVGGALGWLVGIGALGHSRQARLTLVRALDVENHLLVQKSLLRYLERTLVKVS
jgi:hypothetical protein